jgi:hypothetical protein
MFAAIAPALALLCLLVTPAAAETVDASQFVLWLKPWLDAVASAVITAVVAAVGFWARRWIGLEGEARMREALHSALSTGAAAAIAAISDAAARKLSRIEIESELVAGAVSYVLRATPDAVRFFGLDEARLAEMVRAKLIQLLPAAAQASSSAKA